VAGGKASARLTLRAYGGLVFLLAILGVVLFVSAGTLDYWQAWLFLLAFGVPVLFITVYFLRKDPGLIERRVDAGANAETRWTQKVIQSIATVAFLALVLVPGRDRRFGWSNVDPVIVVLANVLVVVGLGVVFFVFRENSYTSAIIAVGEGQKVVSTGPYRFVRHPMYAGALLMIFAMPLALGSLVGEVFAVLMLATIVWRLLDEERYLDDELAGYRDYRQKTRYRLVPLIW